METLLGPFCDQNKAAKVVIMKLKCLSIESKNHKSEVQNPLRILPLKSSEMIAYSKDFLDFQKRLIDYHRLVDIDHFSTLRL